jgi:hypothetical protein
MYVWKFRNKDIFRNDHLYLTSRLVKNVKAFKPVRIHLLKKGVANGLENRRPFIFPLD